MARAAQIRCDSYRWENRYHYAHLSGCVLPLYWPEMRYSTENITRRPVAQHIRDAQNGIINGKLANPLGLPRVRPLQLNFLPPGSLRRANRTKACPKGNDKRPSCDEYPFASTYQGAARNPDFSAVGVSLSANTSAGAKLGWFYYHDHLLDYDPFWVRIVGGTYARRYYP